MTGLGMATRVIFSNKSGTNQSRENDNYKPFVSVIVPTFNRENVICRCLDSVLRQTFVNYEVLVVDDASDDNTLNLVKQYSGQDRRVRYIRKTTNRGVQVARNTGMQLAKGDFIAFLDADDEWFPEKLEKQVNQFQELPEDVALIHCGTEVVNQDRKSHVRRPLNRGYIFQDLIVRGNVIVATSSVIIRYDVISTIGLFDETIPEIEDYEYWIRISRLYKVDFIEDILVRKHHNMSQKKLSRLKSKRRAASLYLFKKYGIEMRSSGIAHRFLMFSANKQVNMFNDFQGGCYFVFLTIIVKPSRFDVSLWFLNILLSKAKISAKKKAKMIANVLK